MITLILAPPRTGKSQLAISLGVKAKEAGKRVFVTNLNQTEAQRQASGFELFGDDGVWPAEGRSEFTGDISRWWEDLPHGSVWIIDEVQQVIPQRGKDKQVLPWVKQLSLHGHHDLTIYLLTQDGMQMDVTARRNCNFTYILSRPLGMSRANIYEYRGFQEMPNDAWRRSQVLKNAEAKKTFKYSKRWQDLYVSASAHEHIKRRFPKRLLLLPIGVAFVAFCLYFAWSRLKPGNDDPANPTTAVVGSALTGAQAPSAANQGEYDLSPVTYSNRWQPRIEGVPMSAPAYDEFEVKDYPRLACYVSGRYNECRCVTQQGSRVEVQQAMCNLIVENGYFDPFKEPPRAEPVRSPEPSGVGQSPTDTAAVAVAPVGGQVGYGDVAAYGQIGVGNQ